jgi:hypothetical protein
MSRIYCKVYTISALRSYPAFRVANEIEDSDFCYLWNDFTVSSSPVPDQSNAVLFDVVTPEWQEFCQQHLGFTVPAASADVRKN